MYSTLIPENSVQVSCQCCCSSSHMPRLMYALVYLPPWKGWKHGGQLNGAYMLAQFETIPSSSPWTNASVLPNQTLQSAMLLLLIFVPLLPTPTRVSYDQISNSATPLLNYISTSSSRVCKSVSLPLCSCLLLRRHPIAVPEACRDINQKALH